MLMKDYYKLSVDETLNELSADSAGLSSEKAAERLAQYGPNRLKEAEKPGFLETLSDAAEGSDAADSAGRGRSQRPDRRAGG